MALSGAEMKILEKLQEKAKMESQPLSNDDLESIETNITSVYDSYPEMLKILNESMHSFCKKLQIISNDNSKLLAEVRRLNNVIYKIKQTHQIPADI